MPELKNYIIIVSNGKDTSVRVNDNYIFDTKKDESGVQAFNMLERAVLDAINKFVDNSSSGKHKQKQKATEQSDPSTRNKLSEAEATEEETL